MNYTTHYNLPQWELSDRIMMEDFNQMCADIDAGIKNAQTAADTLHAVGSYTGDGTAMTDGGQFISTGFRPRFLIISRGWTNTTYPSPYLALVGETTLSDMANYATLQEDGFTVGMGPNNFVKLNEAGVGYSYIAFR